ncbi:Predicted arabinose efflux permease, MFS family [Xaviernesmea oryzae]|uniref:Predicted arabinose efflux permease, MFS family n=1 Tax=Xaviernesmea oryzae TaxID=464029 RepID=A0A1X7GIZ5_9HYPH|nr:MFS transporter [Xaviernesmea oryzae]SMF70446.1 Predicted arabinose efflux permease, MFS family [Xaviernesmea oryzae]
MTRWGHVAIAVLGGIAAALHVGKVPPAIPLLRSELGMDLVAAGWLMGLVSALGAACGFVIGRFTDYLTHRRSMILGLALLIAGSLIGAATLSELLLFASRVLESVGLIMVSVAAPGLIASSIDPRDTGLALALWGVWMPVGVAVMMMFSPFLLPGFGWQGSWVFAAVLSLIPMLALMAMKPAQPQPAGQPPASLPASVKLTASRPVSWILSGIFVAYSASFMSVFGFLPTLLIEEMGIGLTAASIMTALAVLANGVGNVFGGVFARWGAPRWILIAGPCVMLALTAFVVFGHGFPLWMRYAASVLYAVSGGVLPATIMGSLPVYAPRRDLVGTFSGFVMQGSNIGQVFGPMLLASIVAAFGWQGAPYYIAGATGLGFVLALLLRQTERRIAAARPRTA